MSIIKGQPTSRCTELLCLGLAIILGVVHGAWAQELSPLSLIGTYSITAHGQGGEAPEAIDFQEMFREAAMPLCPLCRASHNSGP